MAAPEQPFSLAEQLDAVTRAQTTAHEAWKRMVDAQKAWEGAAMAAELRMGSFLMELDVAIGSGDGDLRGA
jgi:hypothetical protein